MVIQTYSEALSILKRLEDHTLFSPEIVSVILDGPKDVAAYSQNNIPYVPSNDRTSLPHQK